MVAKTTRTSTFGTTRETLNLLIDEVGDKSNLTLAADNIIVAVNDINERFNTQSLKFPCKVATTEELPLATYNDSTKVLEALSVHSLVIDGVTVSSLNGGDRILVKDQSDKKINGIWKVITNAGGSKWKLQRTDDFNSTGDFVAGSFLFVEEGDVNADTGWVLTTNNSGSSYSTIDSDDVVFSKFTNVITPSSSSGIDISGNVISIQYNEDVFSVGSDNKLTLKNDGISKKFLSSDIVGSGIKQDSDGKLSLKISEIVAPNSGLSTDSNGKLKVDAGTGLVLDGNKLEVSNIVNVTTGSLRFGSVSTPTVPDTNQASFYMDTTSGDVTLVINKNGQSRSVVIANYSTL